MGFSQLLCSFAFLYKAIFLYKHVVVVVAAAAAATAAATAATAAAATAEDAALQDKASAVAAMTRSFTPAGRF